MTTVCLFDIDGTLLNSGGAGQYAMEAALLDAFGVRGPYTDIKAAGRTDKAITTDLFAHHRIDVTPEVERTFMEAYLSHLPNALNTKDGRVLPGIIDLLDHLTHKTEVAMGLLTGNYKVGADLKLQHYQLEHHFHFGGFGDVHHNRDDVARTALAEACRHLDLELQGGQIWVIGDTPSDVTCARAIGAKVIAVATGIYTYEQLLPTQPDFLCHDMSDVDAILNVVLAKSPA